MPLITTIAEVKQYTEVSIALQIDTLSPSIRIAERRFIAPMLGPVYATLTEAYTTASENVSDIADADIKSLAQLVQEALANLALMLVVPRVSVQVSDAGIRRNEGDSVKTSFQYQEQNLQESYANAGFDALEDVLALLQQNPNGSFAAWQASDIAIKESQYFIGSASQFNDCYPIYRSRQTYLALRYIMGRLEQQHLRKILGDAQFDDLKNNPGTDANKYLLDNFVRNGIALLTVAKGLREKGVTVGTHGVTVNVVAPDRNRPSREPAPEAMVEPMVKQLEMDGADYLSRLVDYIVANPTNYPLYVAPTQESRLYNVQNTRDNSFYGM